MFRESITSTPLTTEAASQCFGNITGDRFCSDNSFIATLRALVAPRMKEGDKIDLVFDMCTFRCGQDSDEDLARVVPKAVVNCNFRDNTSGVLYVNNLASVQNDNLKVLSILEKGIPKNFPGFVRLEKVREFYRKSFAVDCYINPERKNVMIFVDRLDMKKLHYLQVSILAFMPWYFDPKDGVSDLEMQLLYSLRETTPDKYMECIQKIAEQMDFRTMGIKKMLKGFETKYERMEVRRAQEEIERCNDDIKRLNDRIGERLLRVNELNVRLTGLQRKIVESKDEDSEIMEYFLCNKKLYLDNVNDSYMVYAVRDYLEYFDPEIAKNAIDNPNSFVYPAYNRVYNGIAPEDMKMLMSELFVNESSGLRIKVCAAYKFNIVGNICPEERYDFPSEFKGYLPNPHINKYGCMGNYTMTINEMLQERNYIGALEQTIASCKSLNFADSTVMAAFMNEMYYMEADKFIELPTGESVTPRGAIWWLKENRNKE